MSDGDQLIGEARLRGLSFRDLSLFEQALTHASHAGADEGTYQRLEFLGDRVLGLAVADMLHKDYPQADEGELSRRLNQLVRRETCALVAEDLDLGALIRLGHAEEQAGGRKKKALLGDVCESVIAAIYLDAGFEAAQEFVQKHWRPRMRNFKGPLRDAKTTLQEWAQSKNRGTPTYALQSRDGPDHDPRFTIEVRVEACAPETGTGRSKRDAEQDAAARLLMREGLWDREERDE